MLLFGQQLPAFLSLQASGQTGWRIPGTIIQNSFFQALGERQFPRCQGVNIFLKNQFLKFNSNGLNYQTHGLKIHDWKWNEPNNVLRHNAKWKNRGTYWLKSCYLVLYMLQSFTFLLKFSFLLHSRNSVIYIRELLQVLQTTNFSLTGT